MIHYVPHRLPPHPEGHVTRAAVLREMAQTVEPGDAIPEAETILVDTIPLGPTGELADILPRFSRTVLLARALNHDWPDYPFDVRVTWPYEGTAGEVIAPLVPVGYPRIRDIEVLVVATGLGRPWAAIADELVDAGFAVTLLGHTPWRTRAKRAKGDGAPFMARARVVVGAGGAGTLYGALWAGCAYVVAREANREQAVRHGLATRAGEQIHDGRVDVVEAVRRALRQHETVDIRENGVRALRELIDV